jgi:glycine cleavage system H protein
VESVKSVSEVYAPVSGTVIEVNATATTDTEVVNRDPYKAGFLVKLRINDAAEFDALLDAEAYQATAH